MVVLWELCDAVGSILEAKHRNCCGSVLCVWESSLLGRNNLMPRMKFSSDTMLNISIDVHTMLYACIC